MGTRRRYFFVLLFVLGLVGVSLLVIFSKPTKLGLDLKGGVELVYQGQPTGQVKEVTGADIERSIEIIRERIDQLGVSEPEVSRLGEDQITVSLPDVDNAQRAIDQVGTTAQLYFYDWQPNLIGPEKAIGGRPGQQPPPGPLKASEERWKDAGRDPKTIENEQLVFAGAYPNAYGATLLASEQPVNEDCENCSVAKPRYYLFDKAEPHDLIAGPELAKKDLYISPTGEKRSRDGIVLEVPPGTIVVSEYPSDESGTVDRTTKPGWYALNDDPALSGTDITDPKQEFGQFGEPNVTFNFTDDGRDAFQEVTRAIAQRGQAQAIGPVGGEQAAQLSGNFAVVLDNEVKTRPIINFAENPDGIDGRTGAQISGGFTSPQEAQDLATVLQIGALPINLKLISQTQVSATLGSQALDAGIKAGVIGVILAIIFLVAYYRVLGLVASVALIAYGIIFFALIKLIPITMTLPGIAGLVLTIGVAADSNIVIFERIKEEARAGRSMASAISAGYRRGISTIIDANVITLLTAFILFVLATSGVKGFAFTLGVGTIVSLLTAVVFTQALLGTMGRSRLLQSRSALGAGGEGKKWHFDFIGASRWFFSISGVILIIGGLALATKQLNLGIDFESGTRIKVALEQPTDEEGVRDALAAIGVSGEEIQQVSDPVLGDNVFQIQAAELEPDTVKDAERQLQDEFGVAEDGFDSTSVGPTFGQQVADSALKALIFSLLVICGYVALRFEPKFAVPVLIAIFHDVLITAGVYSLTGKEVSSGTVAAFLTILGYSIYDTIIVFDRIRENVPRMPRAAFSQIVNRSMSEVLTRSLATSFTTLLAVISLLIFGGATLQDFAFAMLVGIASGTYSSIFIASPVLAAWKEREPGFVRRRLRIVQTEGSVPAFADDIALAKLGPDDDETEAEIVADGIEQTEADQPEAEPQRGAVATAERPSSEGNGGDPAAGNGEGESGLSAERRQRNAERKARRQQRRKHGRKR
ncbi:MAG TPA: protein translocase subunit SecD [Solirubrobacterales bacterium]|nr:protein translocase subunit SecD [Solirubrobacterales bacterium]